MRFIFQVIKGFNVLAVVESLGSEIGTSDHDVRILDCGVLRANSSIVDDSFEVVVDASECVGVPRVKA